MYKIVSLTCNVTLAGILTSVLAGCGSVDETVFEEPKKGVESSQWNSWYGYAQNIGKEIVNKEILKQGTGPGGVLKVGDRAADAVVVEAVPKGVSWTIYVSVPAGPGRTGCNIISGKNRTVASSVLPCAAVTGSKSENVANMWSTVTDQAKNTAGKLFQTGATWVGPGGNMPVLKEGERAKGIPGSTVVGTYTSDNGDVSETLYARVNTLQGCLQTYISRVGEGAGWVSLTRSSCDLLDSPSDRQPNLL